MTKAEKAAEEYRDEDFKNNPNGYTVAPYVNSETTATAFLAGWCACLEDLAKSAPEFDEKKSYEEFSEWAKEQEEPHFAAEWIQGQRSQHQALVLRAQAREACFREALSIADKMLEGRCDCEADKICCESCTIRIAINDKLRALGE